MGEFARKSSSSHRAQRGECGTCGCTRGKIGNAYSFSGFFGSCSEEGEIGGQARWDLGSWDVVVYFR